MPTNRPPADPVRDQKAARLIDLQRLRDLTHRYSTDSRTDIREALARMPDTERTEAEEIISRIGDLDSTREQHRQDMLLEIARVEPYLEQLARNPGNAEEVARLRREFGHLRNHITGLPEDPEEIQP